MRSMKTALFLTLGLLFTTSDAHSVERESRALRESRTASEEKEKPAPKPAPRANPVEFETGPHVQQLDADFPVEELEGNGITVDRLGEANYSHGLPPMAEQRRMLHQAGLEFVLNWDGLDQDLFFGLVGENLDRSLEKYKTRAPADGIRKLRRLIDEYRRAERERQ